MSNCKKKATPAPVEEEAMKELDPEELCGVAGGVTDGSQQDTQPADIGQSEGEEQGNDVQQAIDSMGGIGSYGNRGKHRG